MKTKRFLAALLAAVIAFSCVGVVAFAALPQSALYDDNMDSYTTDGTVPSKWQNRTSKNLFERSGYVAGVSGASSDKAISWPIGIGGGGSNTSTDPGDMLISAGWSYGVRMPLGATVKDETIVFDTDVKVGSKTVWATLVGPCFEGQYPAVLSVMGTKLVIQTIPGSGSHTIKNLKLHKEVGTIKPDEWHNLGAVITHSSTNGTTIDFYVDSEKVYTHKDANLKTGVTMFDVITSAYTVKGDPGRFDTRGDYITHDNFYIGSDKTKVKPNFKIESVIPADGSTVAVDSDFSIVMNQPAANAIDVPNALYLTQAGGATVNFKNIVIENETLTGQLSENLFYSEEYTLNQSKNLVNGAGRNLDTKAYKYKTKSMFPVTAKVNYENVGGTATAGLSFSGNSADMKLVMATYDADGVMVNAEVKDVAAYANNASISVDSEGAATVKIFAVDGLATGKLLMEPIVDGKASKSYKQSAETTVSLGDATTADQIIFVEGTTDSVRGWVVAKIEDNEKLNSANIDDYLTYDVIQSGNDGSFEFAGKIKDTEGTYKYTATPAESKNTATGEVEYILGTGKDILTFKIAGKTARLDGDTFYLKLKDVDVSGLLVEFTLPYKATLKCDGKVLTSGKSRINCDKLCTLEVMPEYGESKFYYVDVEVEITDDYDDRNDNLTVIVGGTTDSEGSDVVDPGEWEDPTRVFTDVPKSHWAMTAIEALYERGIVGGMGDGRFAPNKLITREEFASMVSKAFGFSPKNTRTSFDDVPWGAWYENSVYALAENGIVSGIEKHKFGTGMTITRQDMAVILYNVIKDGSVEYVRDYKDFKDQSKIAGYAKDAVKTMYEAGFVSGMEDGTFAPTSGTTKAMAAYMIYSILNK